MEVLYSGKVMVNQDVILHEVLYALTFKYNLLPISKLCKQHQCIAIFTEDYCFMQAPSMKRRQVLGRNHGGLYLLDHVFSTKTSKHHMDGNKTSRLVSFPDNNPTVCNTKSTA